MIVALWLSGTVVSVPLATSGAELAQPTTLVEGIESPQHILVDTDQVLISDHETGQIFSVRQR